MEFLKRRIVSFILLGLMACAVGILIYSSQSSYFKIFPIGYNQAQHPTINAVIGKETYTLDIRLGSRFPLFLSAQIFDSLDIQSKENIVWHDIHGGSHETPSFLIQKMKIGNSFESDVVAIKGTDHEEAILGKWLGKDYNLLLDCPNDRIIISDSFTKLCDKHLAKPNWISIPFELKAGGIVFRVITDLGEKHLSINTTSTVSLLKTTLIPNNKSSISSQLSIGSENFECQTFHAIDLPEILTEIDGFIGMDFFKKHAIYFDCVHKIAYLQPIEYFHSLPVTFKESGLPVLEVLIGEKNYPLELDLGAYSELSLREEVLRNIDKVSNGTAEWRDFKGNVYTAPAYTLPQIKIGDLEFNEVNTQQTREEFHVNTQLSGSIFQPIGTIGRPILEKYNLLLDFPHNMIYASDRCSKLQEAELLSQNLLKIPFIAHKDGILLIAETDRGPRRLILDTGSTHTAIRDADFTTTSQFRIMGYDFGKRSLFPIPLMAAVDYDGYLGLDFLRERKVFIDYGQRCLFIEY
jgi:hypothetical protein